MGGSRAQWPHFEQFDGDAAAGTLPRRFRSRQASTDDANFLMQVDFHFISVSRASIFMRRQRTSANLFIIGRDTEERIPWLELV
jgi:hypothetical protein